MDDTMTLAGLWLLTYLIHSTVLLGGAVCFVRLRGRAVFAETIWRAALFGSVVTASVQLVLASLRPSLLVFQTSASVAARDLSTTDSWHTHAWSTLVRDALPGILPAVLILWLAIALVRLVALWQAHRALRRLLASRVPLLEGALFARVNAICPSVRVSLSTSSRIATPMVFGARELCLPARALESLSRSELDAVLAHELAHVARHDTLWLMLVNLVERALIIQPLNALAARRLRALAECACDDWALRRTRDPLALASALARVTEWLISTPPVGLAIGMASRESVAIVRVRRILDPSIERVEEPQPSRQIALASAIMCGVVVLMPGISASTVSVHPGASVAPAARYTIQAHDDAGPFTITLEQGRIIAMTMNAEPVSAALIAHNGALVHVEDPRGDSPLDLTLTPAGGLRWSSRPTR